MLLCSSIVMADESVGNSPETGEVLDKTSSSDGQATIKPLSVISVLPSSQLYASSV